MELNYNAGVKIIINLKWLEMWLERNENSKWKEYIEGIKRGWKLMYIYGEQIFKKLKIHVGLWLENQKSRKPLNNYHNKQTDHE